MPPDAGGRVIDLRHLGGVGNKYGARRTWSELCQRWFASMLETRRGETLAILEKAGEIFNLEYQPRWVLSEKPRTTYRADFKYHTREGVMVVEDVKGKDTEASQVRRAWLRQQFGIEVVLVRPEDV